MMSTRGVLLIQCLILSTHIARCSPPADPIKCASGNTDCTVTNTYGTFPDRTTCRAASAAYPASEAELISVVANATMAGKSMRAATRHSHSIPKLACPRGKDGIVISTRGLNRLVGFERSAMTMTVESGMTLEALIEAAAAAGFALPHAPYWWGVTVGGMLGTGAHGSSLWGTGSAVHEYVVSIRIVTPASMVEGYAKVRSLAAGNPDMDAVKVNLGVLGVIYQVTFQLQPLFKRSITYQERDEGDLADCVTNFGHQHEFADIRWYPGKQKVIYRIDSRISANITGNGRYNAVGFRALPTAALLLVRSTEETLEATGNTDGKCLDSAATSGTLTALGWGITNNNILFTGYPVVGYQNRLQSSGSCLNGPEDALFTSCPWDPRVKASFFYQTTISIGLSQIRDFILDIQRLRDLQPKSLCGVELYDGVLMRYVRASTAFLGKQEDVLDIDITYYRSHDPMAPRLYEDALEEIEQMAVFKYGGLPHWGKNRNLAFYGVDQKYGRMKDFVKVKDDYDPRGLFSNEWTDAVLGIEGVPTVVKEGCALEGLCVCSEDIHCAPKKGYLCRPGRVYTDARVCTHVL